MKGRASEAGKAQNEDFNLQREKKEGGKKSNLGAEPCSSLAAPLPRIWGFSPQTWTWREAPTAGLQPATQAHCTEASIAPG